MKLLIGVGVFVAALLTGKAVAPSANALPPGELLTAPTYYVAAEVVGCKQDSNSLEFRGATNLPPGALMTVVVSDFDSDAWKSYSEEAHVPVTEQGFFAGEIQSKKGMHFHRNLLLHVYFAPFQPKQPESVLVAIGKKGERLQEVANTRLDVSNGLQRPAVNPQLIQWSGDIHGLSAIARVPNCGEKDWRVAPTDLLNVGCWPLRF